MKAEDYGFEEYRKHSPTCFDSHINIDGDEDSREHWAIMPVSQTRDSGPLEQSNFAQFLDGLGGESDTVEVHRFGHWGPGWYEIILVDPDDEKAMKKAYDMAGSLQDYPVLDEMDHSQRQHDDAMESWDNWARNDVVRHVSGSLETFFNETFGEDWDYDPESMAEAAVDKYVEDNGMPDYEEESSGMYFPCLDEFADKVYRALLPLSDIEDEIEKARKEMDRIEAAIAKYLADLA